MNLPGIFTLLALLLIWHPLALFAIALALLRILHVRPPRLVGLTASVITLIAYTAFLTFYATTPEFTDHLEPTLAALTELFTRGEPLYHARDAAPRYAMLYGPVLYPLRAAFVAVLSPGSLAIKLPGVLASLLALACLHVALRNLHLTAVAALACACFGPIAYFAKSDPLMLACTAAALCAALRAPRAGALFGVALGLGVATNLKPPAALNFLPVLWILRSRFGFIAATQSAIAGALVAALPFVLLPQASLPNYLAWLRSAGAHGLDAGIFSRNLEWTTLLLAPSVILLRRDALVPLALLAFALSIASLAGSKAGGGIGHLLPLIPIAAYVAHDLARQRPDDDALPAQIALALGITFLAVALPMQSNIARSLTDRARLDARGDLLAFQAAHPGKSVHVGVATDRTYPLTDHRIWLVLSGQRYLIDTGALMDMAGAGVPLPAATIDAMRQADVWLLPRDDDPFAITCWYPPHAPVFDERFREAFRAAFRRTGSTRLFDVYIRAP